MKKACIFLLLLCILLNGCITVDRYTYRLDPATGGFERTYHDLKSLKDKDEKDYSIEKDWKELERLVSSDESDYDEDVIALVGRELFQEGEVLSAREQFRVKCPKCFPNVAAMLNFLFPDEFRFETINDEVVMLEAGGKLLSSNGSELKTEANNLVLWPAGTTNYVFVVKEGTDGGESLLPFHRAATPIP